MYFPYVVTYMVVGFVISIIVFVWALRNGQFRDQARARYLPLRDDPDGTPVRFSKLHRFESYAMLGLVCVGLMATAAVLFFTLLRW